jgi:hypothetical protein
MVVASEMNEPCQLVPFHQRFVPLPEPDSRIVSRRLVTGTSFVIEPLMVLKDASSAPSRGDVMARSGGLAYVGSKRAKNTANRTAKPSKKFFIVRPR